MSLTLAQRVIAESVSAFWNHPEEQAIAFQAAAEAIRMYREATYPPAPDAFDAYENAAHIAEHLNGWGYPPAPELADHIAKCIRDMAAETGLASGMSAFGQDAEERLEAKPASPTGEAGDAQGPSA